MHRDKKRAHELYQYEKVRAVRLVGIALFVYCAKHLRPHITCVSAMSAATGFFNMLVCCYFTLLYN